MRFVAIDVETANARMRSICQIGIVVFEHGKELSSDVVLVDPREEFDGMNISIHGIDETHVVGAKTFPQIFPWLAGYARDQVVVCHTHFDRVAIAQAHDHHRLTAVPCRWLDTAKVARRACPSSPRAVTASEILLTASASHFGIMTLWRMHERRD